MSVPSLGVIFPPDQPPERLFEVADAVESSGVAELWLWEDCFAESGLAPAAAVLGRTGTLRVGVGLMPVPLRNVTLLAMELATLARLFPGRLRPGIGHGVLDWMGQAGVRAASPMTLLGEYTDALRQLLHGDTVTTAGRYVTLTDVGLTWPPGDVPPVLVGAVGARTLDLAGARGDGVILTGDTGVEGTSEGAARVRAAWADAARDGAPEIVAFATVDGVPDASRTVDLVRALGDAGATTVALHSVGDGRPPLPEFARLVGEQVVPRLGSAS